MNEFFGCHEICYGWKIYRCDGMDENGKISDIKNGKIEESNFKILVLHFKFSWWKQFWWHIKNSNLV